MAFDIDGARRAGYSDDEIADFLGQDGAFDVAGARAAGYSSADIIGHFAGPKKALPEGVKDSGLEAGRGGAEFAATDPRRIVVSDPNPAAGRRFRGEAPLPAEAQYPQQVIGDVTPSMLLNTPAKPGNESPATLEQMSKSPELQARDIAASAPKPSLRPWKPTQAERAGEIAREVTGSQAAGDAAMRAADTYMLAPEALATGAKLASDIANLATLGGTQAASEWMGQVVKGVQAQKSPRYQAAQADLGKLLQDDRAGVLDVVEFLASNPGFAAELGLPSLPSVLIGAGAGRVGGAINAALTARRGGGAADVAAAFRSGAAAGATAGNVAMNAGDTFTETDGELIDKLLAAVPAAAGTALAGRLPGAERVLAGSGAGGSRLARAGVTAGAEGLQEGAESLSQSLGKGTVEGNFDLGDAAKTAVVEAGAGGIIGGLAGAVSAAPPAPSPVYDVEALARSKGFLGGQLTSFTPADSEVARAGVTPVAVPVAPGNAPQVTPAGGITPPAAGRPDFTKAMAAVDQRLQGDEPAATAATAPTTAPGEVAAVDAPAAQEVASEAGGTQPPTPEPMAAPASTWTGRRGDGYAVEADAAQALPGRQRKQPDLDWRVEARPDGKFVLNGYARAATAETTDASQQRAPQPGGQGLAEEAGRVGGMVRAGQDGGAGVQPGRDRPLPTQGAVADGGAQAPGAGDVSGQPVAAAPSPDVIASDLAKIQDARLRGKNPEAVKLEVSPSQASPIVSAFGAAFGAPVTMVRATRGKPTFGAVVLDRNRIYVNENAPDAPLVLAVHEIVHTLPAGIRGALVDRAMQHSTPKLKAKFLKRYNGYQNLSSSKQDEEMVAMFAQDDAKTPEFWASLRDKLGDRDFAGLAKHIIAKLNQLLATVRGGDDRKFFTDIEAVRDLVTDALARAERGETYWADDLEVSGDGGVDVGEISMDEAGFSEDSRSIKPELEAAGVTPEVVDLYLKYKAADGAVGNDAYMAGRGTKAAKTRAFNKLMEVASRGAFSRLDMAYEMGGADAIYDDAQFSDAPRDYKLDVQRAARDEAKTAGLAKDEVAAIQKDGASLGLTKQQIDGVLAEARDTRKRFPVRAGWAPIKAIGIAVERDKKTKEIKVDKKGRPKISVKWETIPYAFNVPAGKSRAPQKHDRELAKKVSTQFTSMVKDIFRRAEAGDKNAQTIIGHQTWYRNVAEILRREFGSQGDLFSDLLGATSPNTPVDTNWRFAIEILERFSKGEFDSEMEAFIEHIESGRKPSEFEGKKIAQASGKLYGMNSTNSMIALANLWRNIEPGSAPKARNFALNLIGQSNMATIDVWAARMLRRAADRVRGMSLPRIPVVAEQGVTGTWNADASGVGGEFGFGALVLDMVSADLKKDGIDMPPPDLHALAWFAEKELWTQENWTSVQGEGGSFEENIDKNPTSRYLAGFSVQQGEVRPEDGVVSTAQARLLTTLRGDPTVISARVLPTYGMFMGKPEEALDVEWTVERGQHDPSLFLAEASRIAKERTQMAIFVSRVMQPDEENSNARPGAEVYFKTGVGIPRVREIMQTFMDRGLDGFTLAVDPRTRLDERPGEKYIGVRIQYVPEFDDNAKPENVEQLLAEKSDALDDAVRELLGLDGVAYAKAYKYDTEVVSGDRYDDYIDRGLAEANSQAGGEAWPQRSVRERLEGATARIQSDAGQDGQGGVPDAGAAADSVQASEIGQPERDRDRGRRQESRVLAPLEGAPRVDGATGPDPRLVEVAEAYAKSVGITLVRQSRYVDVDITRAKRIAAAYEAMPHAPRDPRVAAAYRDLIKQTRAQYQALADAGFQFWFYDETNDPYQGNPWNAMRDLRRSQRMGVFATAAGFGSGATDLNVDDNPLLADTGVRWGWGSPDGRRKPVLANDLFRAVHDAFGHGLEGAGFRARGEENAWQAHARLFTGPALAALTSETRGQNSWLNFGPHGDKNQTARVEDTVFADQKTGLMPSWTWDEGAQFSDAESAEPAATPRGSGYRSDEGVRQGVRGTSVTGIHYGLEKGLSVLSGAAFGRGIDGKERERLALPGTDPRIRRRVYFYLPVADASALPRPEAGLGPHVYRASLGGLYDDSASSRSDRERIQALRKAPGDSAMESALLDAGYRGYVARDMGVAVVLNADVPVAYEGTIDWARVRDRQVERIQPRNETRREGDELVRKIDNADMVAVIRARPQLTREAPSFRLQYGEGRVLADQAEAANAVLAEAGAEIRFSDSEDANFSDTPWYSALSRALAKGPPQAPAEQWRAFLKGLPSKGVKQDEITWSGVEDWLQLQTGKVSREAVVAFVDANGVRVEEVVLGNGGLTDAEMQEVEDLRDRYQRNERGDDVPFDAGDFDRLQALEQREGGDSMTKFGQFTLPGGANYREIALTLPGKEIYRVPPAHSMGEAADVNRLAHIRVNDRVDADGKKVLFVEEIQSDWGQAGAKKTGRRLPDGSDERVGFRRPFAGKAPEIRGEQLTVRELLAREGSNGKDWLDGQNAMRADLNERPLTDSDPVQVIYEDGKMSRATSRIRGTAQQWADQIARDWKRLKDTERQQWVAQQADKPPLAPFIGKTDAWVALALKRVVTMATRGGYDRVAFVTGAQSADRYSLDKQVDELRYGDGLLVAMKNGAIVVNKEATPKELPDLIGKEAAERLLNNPTSVTGSGYNVLSGVDLKVGGEGMKSFYDVIVPAAAKALLKKVGGGAMGVVGIAADSSRLEIRPHDDKGYLIRNKDTGLYFAGTGGWVGYTSRPAVFDSEKVASDRLRELQSELDSSGMRQPGFDITPAMREAAAGGLPMFSDYENEKARFGRKFLPNAVAPKKMRARDLKVGSVKSDKAVAVLTRTVDSEYPIINAARKAGDAVGTAWKEAVEALPGKTADRIEQTRRRLIVPLTDAIGKASKRLKIKPGQLVDAYGIYRTAMHAAERNKTLRANGSKKANPSGMSEAEASQWQTFFRGEPELLRALQSFDPLLGAIQAETDAVKMAAGLLTQDDIDARSDWDWYISLRGDPGADDVGGSRGQGGWNNDIDPKARGRDSLSANPVVNTVKMLENAIRLAEMATVKKATYEFAVAHPDIIGAKVTRLVNRPLFDENGNFAKAVPNREKFDTNAIVYRQGDVEFHIEIGDGKVAEAMKRMERDDMGIVLRGLGKFTSLMGRLWTQFSPHFPLVNFIRDLQQQLAYIVGSDIKIGGRSISTMKAAWMIATRYPMTFAAAVSEVMGRAPSGKYTAYARELAAAGGMSGFTKMLSDDDALNDFVKEVAWKAGKAKTSLVWDKFVDAVAGVSEVFEMTTRAAAYSVMRDMGMGKDQAANFTKNLMNFSKAGTETRKLGNLYMFLKPAVQDVYLTSKLLRTRKGAIVFASMYAGALALYAMMRELSGDDDEDKRLKKMDTRTASERRSYFLLPIGDEEPVRFPVGFGLPRMAWGLAVATVDLALNPDYDAIDAADNALKSLTSTLSPLQLSDINMFKNPAEFLTTTFSPTLLVPVIEFGQNKTKGGSTIFKNNSFYSAPDYAKGFSSTPKEWKDAVQWMYDKSGGDIDIAPETLPFIIRSYGGGPATLLLNALNSREKLRQDEDLTRRDVPIVQAFTGPRDRYPERRFRDLSQNADAIAAKVKDSELRGGDIAKRILSDKEKALVASMKKDIDTVEREEAQALADIRKIQLTDYDAGARELKRVERQSRAAKQLVLDGYNQGRKP